MRRYSPSLPFLTHDLPEPRIPLPQGVRGRLRRPDECVYNQDCGVSGADRVADSARPTYLVMVWSFTASRQQKAVEPAPKCRLRSAFRQKLCPVCCSVVWAALRGHLVRRGSGRDHRHRSPRTKQFVSQSLSKACANIQRTLVTYYKTNTLQGFEKILYETTAGRCYPGSAINREFRFVPNLRAAKKSIRKNLVRRDRNKHITSTMRSAIKQVREATDAAGGQTALARAVSIIDRSQKKGVIHKNTASRYKSRLTHFVRGLS